MGRRTATFFVPDGSDPDAALARTTHLAVGAHADDLEIMALHGILAGLDEAGAGFTGVVVTDGSGSPRGGSLTGGGDEEMRARRRREQERAAELGRYSAVAFLDYPSAAARAGEDPGLVPALVELLGRSRPRVLYTHNLADAHDTHVAVCLRVIAAARQLPLAERPEQVYGCEVWRSLDWLTAADRIDLDISGGDRGDGLAARLVSLFASQIAGGKRYDLATLGRRRANAVFRDPYAQDVATAATVAMDLTPLVTDPGLDPAAFVAEKVQRLGEDIAARLRRLGGV
jgi:LmbE family N-acetylglucosaminyl deacetylase